VDSYCIALKLNVYSNTMPTTLSKQTEGYSYKHDAIHFMISLQQ